MEDFLPPASAFALRDYEKARACRILAFKEAEAEPAAIEPQELDQIHHLEVELGVCLVAVQ
jgi:hypothetical protein